MKTVQFFLCIAAGIILATPSARGNVYATDIKLNASLSNITTAASTPVTITYRLNQPATSGVTIGIWQGTTQVATIIGGANMGLNTVVWGLTNNSGAALTSGTYSFNVTAAAEGFTNWQQISVDGNAGNYAFYANGIAVDNNADSPYYGRVVLGCSAPGGTNPVSGEIIMDGIYKMNADGSFADEGGFGFGGYTNDDGGNPGTGEMPSMSGVVPWKLRIGADDRIYMLDFSDEGAIVAFDMQVTTNQVVIDDGGALGGSLGGPHNYAGNPDLTDLSYGIGNFDVTSTDTANAAVWLCDDDYPNNWGIWMYHLKNGASDVTDTGTQAVATGGDLSLVSSGGCTVDAGLDIFCGQTVDGENAVYDAMVFTNWNFGILPSASGGFSDALGTTAGEVEWGYGCGVDATCATNPTFEAVQDVVVNSRTSPTIVACPMGAGNDDTNGSGIRLLDAASGAVITVTNGNGVVQTLTNLDFGQEYTCAAWDNVGNLYAASTTRNVWRVWSPPGPSTNTTVATATVLVGVAPPPQVPTATATISGVASGSSYDYTITLQNTGSMALNSFWYGWTTGGNNLPSSPTSAGNSLGWSNSVSGNSIMWTNGSGAALGPGASATFTFVSSSSPSAITTSPAGESVVYTGGIDFTEDKAGDSSAAFSPVLVTSPPPGQLKITRITVSGGTVTIDFTASSTALASSFALQSSSVLNGTYGTISGAVVTGSQGVFSVSTTTSGATEFYRISE